MNTINLLAPRPRQYSLLKKMDSYDGDDDWGMPFEKIIIIPFSRKYDLWEDQLPRSILISQAMQSENARDFIQHRFSSIKSMAT
jgi:hypothetical protein